MPVLIILSNCLTCSFTLLFLCFGCLIWRAFASVKSSSSRPCFHRIMRRLRVLELDPFLSEFLCGRTIAIFIATIEIGVFSTNDNSCWISDSMNMKPCVFSLRTMKRGFQLTKFLYMSFILIPSSWSISFQGSKGAVVIAGGDGLDCVALGSTFVSGVAGDVSF